MFDKKDPGQWIRGHLEALEDEILAAYTARAQFALNEAVYQKGYRGNAKQSMLDAMLLDIETVYARFGRYTDPLERPFNGNLPPPERKIIVGDRGLKLKDYRIASVNPEIMESYLGFLAKMCKPGDDSQYGSSAEHDIASLLVTAERKHSGMLVAEWKFQEDTDGYTRLINAKDWKGIEAKLTVKKVEEDVIQRVYDKAERRMQEANQDVRQVIQPDLFADFFRAAVIPLTKIVEVRYFQHRVN